MESAEKSNIFIERTLRSALDICKHGGSVTEQLKEKVFRMLYDNRRRIIDIPIPGKGSLRDSNPVNDVEEASLNRFVGRLNSSTSYNKNTHTNVLSNKYKGGLDIGVRTFVRGLFSKSYNLDSNCFKNYSEIVDFIKTYDKSIKINENIISTLKRRSVEKRLISKTPEMESFVQYLQTKYPNLDVKAFYGKG